jgi:hypothetical protein
MWQLRDGTPGGLVTGGVRQAMVRAAVLRPTTRWPRLAAAHAHGPARNLVSCSTATSDDVVLPQVDLCTTALRQRRTQQASVREAAEAMWQGGR